MCGKFLCQIYRCFDFIFIVFLNYYMVSVSYKLNFFLQLVHARWVVHLGSVGSFFIILIYSSTKNSNQLLLVGLCDWFMPVLAVGNCAKQTFFVKMYFFGTRVNKLGVFYRTNLILKLQFWSIDTMTNQKVTSVLK